jgi:predicted transcriptional regulator
MSAEQSRAARLIVLQLLRDDHWEWWTRLELSNELRLPGAELASCIEHLERAGVVATEADRLRASASARLLDSLGLIGV